MIWQIGDIVVRADIKGRKKYVIVRLASDQSGYVYARPLNGGQITTFYQFQVRRA